MLPVCVWAMAGVQQSERCWLGRIGTVHLSVFVRTTAAHAVSLCVGYGRCTFFKSGGRGKVAVK